MKKSLSFDLAFIIISGLILLGINYATGAELLGKFSIIVALAGYFVGKAVKNYELKNVEEK